MGFFDRVKNMFTEEVEDDVKVEQVKKEVTHVSIESPKKEDFVLNEALENTLEEELNFSRPVFFDDNDFKDLNLDSEIETKKTVENDIYNQKVEVLKEEKKVFKPTPIISPVYGILDKNYHKEDIVSKNDKDYKSFVFDKTTYSSLNGDDVFKVSTLTPLVLKLAKTRSTSP